MPGGATSDSGFANITAFREQHFPMERLLKALTVQIENATSFIDVDKTRILNAVAENIENVDGTPSIEHPHYVALNNAVRDEFVCFTSNLQNAVSVDAI